MADTQLTIAEIAEQRAADLSLDGRYRYTLSRIWDASKPLVLFIGLNPSTADAVQDDPTIRRCRAFAKSWGYGGMLMANLFAFRATEPTEMMQAADPIGPENDAWLLKCAEKAALVVAAWGTKGKHLKRDHAVVRLLHTKTDLYCLKVVGDHNPGHPLYLKAELKPQLWHQHCQKGVSTP